MSPPNSPPPSPDAVGIRIQEVRAKRDLDQALNAKEFAVLDGVSYSAAREWFRLPGFQAVLGKVFWHDFVWWRRSRNSISSGQGSATRAMGQSPVAKLPTESTADRQIWPNRASKILQEVG
jgi:hypothetical protein